MKEDIAIGTTSADSMQRSNFETISTEEEQERPARNTVFQNHRYRIKHKRILLGNRKVRVPSPKLLKIDKSEDLDLSATENYQDIESILHERASTGQELTKWLPNITSSYDIKGERKRSTSLLHKYNSGGRSKPLPISPKISPLLIAPVKKPALRSKSQGAPGRLHSALLPHAPIIGGISPNKRLVLSPKSISYKQNKSRPRGKQFQFPSYHKINEIRYKYKNISRNYLSSTDSRTKITQSTQSTQTGQKNSHTKKVNPSLDLINHSFELQKYPTIDHFLDSKQRNQTFLDLACSESVKHISELTPLNPNLPKSTLKDILSIKKSPVLSGKTYIRHPTPSTVKTAISKSLAQININRTSEIIDSALLGGNQLSSCIFMNNELKEKLLSGNESNTPENKSHRKRFTPTGINTNFNSYGRIPLNRSFIKLSEKVKSSTKKSNHKGRSRNYDLSNMTNESLNIKTAQGPNIQFKENLLNCNYNPYISIPFQNGAKKIVLSRNSRFMDLIIKRIQAKKKLNEAASQEEKEDSFLSYYNLKKRNQEYLNDLRYSDARKFNIRAKYGIAMRKLKAIKKSCSKSDEEEESILNSSIHTFLSPKNHSYLKALNKRLERGNISSEQIYTSCLDLADSKAILNNWDSTIKPKSSILAPPFPLYNQKMIDSIKKVVN